jgi:hypothetical protein
MWVFFIISVMYLYICTTFRNLARYLSSEYKGNLLGKCPEEPPLTTLDSKSNNSVESESAAG